MCGICGLVSLDGATAPDPAVLAAMNETLLHRGPDSDGSVIDGPCGLAMRRLSIIDLAGGDQPIANEDGRIQVIQNGEIYNYRDLREELRGRGHTFRRTATPRCWSTYMKSGGRRSSKRCAGCSRSPSGTPARAGCCSPGTASASSPSTTASPTGTVSFGSELKALLRQPGFSREIDPQALESFLAFNSIPSPLTIFKEARKLPAGHIADRREGGGDGSRASRGPAARAGRGRGAKRGRRGARRGAARSPPGFGQGPPGLGRARSACSFPAASTRPP